MFAAMRHPLPCARFDSAVAVGASKEPSARVGALAVLKTAVAPAIADLGALRTQLARAPHILDAARPRRRPRRNGNPGARPADCSIHTAERQ
jgi:hypothetical protein